MDSLFDECFSLSYLPCFIKWNENKQEKNEVQSSVTTQDSIQETPDNTPNNGTDYKIKAVIDDIMSQQLSNYTPMQALNYLNSLQERIKNEGLSD